jgi:aminoglycoside phosphotransferase (APT) family kinase protein
VPDDDAKGLHEWIRRAFDADTEVVELNKGTAGFSNETWLLTTAKETGGKTQERGLVLRKPREEIKFFPTYDIGFQYRVLQALRDTSVPAPNPVVFEEDPSHIGTPFYLMERIAPHTGVVPYDGPPSGIHGMGLFHDASVPERRRLWDSAIEAIAEIHSIDLAAVQLPFARRPHSLREAVEDQLAVIEQWHRFGSPEPIPALANAIQLLRNDIPEQDDVVLCWGDPKPGNIVYVDGRVAGVLDWEMSYLGTPEMDLMYWIITDDVSASTFGVPRLEGCPGRDETIRHYEQVSGRKLKNLEYHQLFQTLRLAVLLVLADRVVTQMGLAEHFPENWSTNNEPYRRLLALT